MTRGPTTATVAVMDNSNAREHDEDRGSAGDEEACAAPLRVEASDALGDDYQPV